MPIDIAVNRLTYGLIKNLSECVAKLTALKSFLDPKLNPCFHQTSSKGSNQLQLSFSSFPHPALRLRISMS